MGQQSGAAPPHRVPACASLKAAMKSPILFPAMQSRLGILLSWAICWEHVATRGGLPAACCLNRRDWEEAAQEEARPGWALLGATAHVAGGGLRKVVIAVWPWRTGTSFATTENKTFHLGVNVAGCNQQNKPPQFNSFLGFSFVLLFGWCFL